MQRATKKVSPKKEFFKTFNLSFNTEELIEALEKDDPEKSMALHNKRVWTKDHKPELLNEIDRQLRKNFNIQDDSKFFLTIYSPSRKKLEIKESSQHVSTRVIIDTITENISFKSMNNMAGDLEIRQWEALMIPPFTSSILNFEISNKNTETIQGKKGFRSQRRTKNISNRYLIIFDYLINKNDFDQINKIFNKKDNYNPKSSTDKKDFEKALKDLIS